jgi:phage repressor protein C with HTH and peptisase S24 domain
LQRTPLDVRAMLVKLAGNTGTASMAIPVGEGVSGSGEPLYGAINMLSETVGWPDVRGRETISGRVGDDSMAPMYRRGDIVIFAPDQAPQSGEDAYVRLVDGRVVFVRIFFETDDGGGAVVRLQPRNSKNRAVTYPGEQIAAAYGAVYRYQRVEGE